MKFARMTYVVALVATASVGPSASAQTGSADSRASKWERAKVQIETVCREHEAKQRFDLAAQCYDDVTAMLTAAPAAAPVAAAPVPAAPVVAEPPRRPQLPAVAAAPKKPIVTAVPKKPVAAPRIARRPEAKPVRVAARPAPRLTVAAAPPAAEVFLPWAESRRCAGVRCQQYVLLGIGY